MITKPVNVMRSPGTQRYHDNMKVIKGSPATYESLVKNYDSLRYHDSPKYHGGPRYHGSPRNQSHISKVIPYTTQQTEDPNMGNSSWTVDTVDCLSVALFDPDNCSDFDENNDTWNTQYNMNERFMVRKAKRVLSIPPTVTRPKKQLIFIRHGEAYHNALFASGDIVGALNTRDPLLTSVGNQQVCRLRKEINKLAKTGYDAEVVLTSPLTRAIQTAYGAFYDQGVRIEACNVIAELCDARCNEGNTSTKLKKFWYFVDFRSIPEKWWSEGETGPKMLDRVSIFREWIRYRPETNIAIVSHGGFLYALLRLYFKNCEVKAIEWPSK